MNYLALKLSILQTPLMNKEDPKPVKVAHSFYIPLELLDAIKQRARDMERSVNWLAIKIMSDWLKLTEKGDPK